MLLEPIVQMFMDLSALVPIEPKQNIFGSIERNFGHLPAYEGSLCIRLQCGQLVKA